MRLPSRILLAPLLLLLLTESSVANEALLNAARTGDATSLATLLQQGSDVQARAADGSSALHWATLGGHHAAMRTLLAAGADASATDRYGTTPLSLAALNGDATTTELLLTAGATANALDAAGESVLMTAVRTGNASVVNLLLDHGALVGYREPVFGLTPLALAALEGHAELVTRLLQAGARVNAATRVGPTPPFILPCKGGCGSEGVGMNRGGVPDRGERPEVEGGMTPLLYAARDGNLEVARALVAAGADIELADGNAIGPLLMSLINGKVELAYFLLDHGARVDVADFYGRTPLFAAVEYRNLDMDNNDDPNPTHNGVDRSGLLPLITRLLEAGADVDARTREYPPSRRWIHVRNDISWVDMTGQTPFVRAAFSGDVEVMRLLLQHGANPALTTFGGTSALMAAAGINWREGQSYTVSPAALLEAVGLCIELGLDVNAVNSMGISAVMGAANRGSDDILQLLVDHGASFEGRDKEGRGVMMWAKGVFLGDLAARPKPSTMALLQRLGVSEE